MDHGAHAGDSRGGLPAPAAVRGRSGLRPGPGAEGAAALARGSGAVKIGIGGSGIAGNGAAYKRHREHEITVYEADGHIGGHSHTHVVRQAGRDFQVDTGFIVYNEWTYPQFTALLKELDVATQATTMSFSVRNDRKGLEYNGTTINTLFAQRRNIVRPSFLAMV